MASVDKPPHPFSFRDYRVYWIGKLASTLGQSAMVVVIGWQVYDIARATMSPRDAAFQLGLIGVVQFVPLALLTLVTGWTADRIDRRWIARTTVLLELGCAAVLAHLAWRHETTLPALFAVAAVLGVSRAFANPALNALAPNLVPAPVLPTAIATSAVAWQAGAIVGPALGGYLYAVRPHLPFTVAACLFALSAAMLFALRPIAVPRIAGRAHPVRQMVDGLRYVRRNRLVLGAISLDLFAVLLGGATAMLPIYARDVLHVGSAGLGNLRAAPAVGSMLMAVWLGIRPIRSEVGVKMLAAVVVFGLMTMLFGWSRSLPLSLAALAVLGAADMISVYVRQSLVQLHTPNEMRGRVAAISSLFISGSNELGEAESGLLASLIGPTLAVVLGGAGAVGVTLVWAWLFPELRRARTFDPPVTEPSQEERP